ncbi:hypothetical protein ERJ75_001577000 [Trypanosoma vivax]|nr:hypothetical protein ERJ75_001577000 [Trypanosoma vivax]
MALEIPKECSENDTVDRAADSFEKAISSLPSNFSEFLLNYTPLINSEKVYCGFADVESLDSFSFKGCTCLEYELGKFYESVNLATKSDGQTHSTWASVWVIERNSRNRTRTTFIKTSYVVKVSCALRQLEVDMDGVALLTEEMKRMREKIKAAEAQETVRVAAQELALMLAINDHKMWFSFQDASSLISLENWHRRGACGSGSGGQQRLSSN